MIILRYPVLLRVLGMFVLCTPGFSQDNLPPLPELGPFLKEVRSRLRTDRILLSQYTYTQKDIERELDKNGQARKTTERVYEVYPSLEDGLTYMRLISKDGKPLSEKQLQKQDRDQDKKRSDHDRDLAREGTDAKSRRLLEESEERKKEEKLLDEVFQLYEFSIAGREDLDGRPAIRVSFRPHLDYQPKSREARILAKVAGDAWVDESDREVVRVRVELIDTVTFGLGILARLNKGATATLRRSKVNDEIWLPAAAQFAGTARIMLLKGLRIDAETTFGEYRKFSVETLATPPTPKK